MMIDDEPDFPAVRKVSRRDFLLIIMVGLGAGTVLIALGSRVLSGRGAAPNMAILLADNAPAKAVNAAWVRRDTRLLALRQGKRVIVPGVLGSLEHIRIQYGLRLVNPASFAEDQRPRATARAMIYAARYNQIMRAKIIRARGSRK